MNTFETVTDVLEGHFSSTHSTVSGIKKQKKQVGNIRLDTESPLFVPQRRKWWSFYFTNLIDS